MVLGMAHWGSYGGYCRGIGGLSGTKADLRSGRTHRRRQAFRCGMLQYIKLFGRQPDYNPMAERAGNAIPVNRN